MTKTKAKKAAKSDSETETPKKSAKASFLPPINPKKGKNSAAAAPDSDSEAEVKSTSSKKKKTKMMEELEALESESEALKVVDLSGTKYLSTSDHFLFKLTDEPGAPGAYVGQLDPETGVIDATVDSPFDVVEA